MAGKNLKIRKKLMKYANPAMMHSASWFPDKWNGTMTMINNEPRISHMLKKPFMKDSNSNENPLSPQPK